MEPKIKGNFKIQVIKYCSTGYERNGRNVFWKYSIKNSGEFRNKLKSKGF